MAGEIYRTYEVLIEESVHPDHSKRAKNRTSKPTRFNAVIDGALRDTHMIFQDAVCYYTLLFAGLAGRERHKSGEYAGELLNPLWEHVTGPASKGGIVPETDKVIRRLIEHYKPLADVENAYGDTLAEKFLNTVYSKPLQIRGEMPDAEWQAVLDLRVKCYRILEKFGTKVKGNGARECADVSEFKNNWAGLMCDPESDAEIPGNGAYDRIWRELRTALKNVRDDEEASRIINETLKRYAEDGEKQNQGHCEQDYKAELKVRKQALADAESLPEDDKKKATEVKRAKASLEEWKSSKAKHDKTFFDERRKKLADAVVKAFAEPFGAEKGTDIGLTDAEFAEATRRVKEVGADPATKAAAHIRLHYKGGATGNFEKAMFRYWILRDNSDVLVKRAALADFRWFILKEDKRPGHHPKEEPTLDNELIKAMPFVEAGADVAFLYFGKHCLGIPTTDSSPDSEFDKIAFATAVEDVFKYTIRSDARKARVRKLLNVVQAFENNGAELSAEHNPTGKTMNVRGMGDDPRWKCDQENKKGIVQALASMSEDKKIGGYGLRESTIGGWAEVRKAFLSLHKKARDENGEVSDQGKLAEELIDAVDAEMEQNRQGFGSADFFHVLCDPVYWHLWLEGSEYERNGVRDFIPHYVGYCEWREELVGLLLKEDGTELERETELSSAEMGTLAKRPIRYTWPGLLNRHKKPSYRFYDFAGELNTVLQFKSLFRRIRAKDANGNATGAVEEYKQLTGDSAKVTLAARRLKRDRIMSKDKEGDGWNSIDALWCPPLILAGEESPTPANRPRAGKYEDAKKKAWPKEKDAEVSFSLMAAPLPHDPWMKFSGDSFVPGSVAEPVHLTVSFKLEANALATLQNEGVYFAGGSAKGVDEEDEKRKFLRWPVDIDTEKVAAADAEKKAKEGKPWIKPTRKADVTPDKLWCAFNGGFLVKESRYSKAEKTRRVPEFHILGVDLGNRFAAAFTRFRIHAEPNGEGREISADGFSPVIKAEVTREGTLRLQGENAKVWDHVRNEDGTCKRGANGNFVYALEDETYGNGGRGRFPTDDEYNKLFAPLAERLVPASSLGLAGKEQTYPELGDHLVFRLKRRIGRLRTLFNLVWRLCGKYERDNRTGKHDKRRTEKDWLFHKRMVVETLARSKFSKRPRQPGEQEEPADVSLRAALAVESEWQKLKDEGLLDDEKGAKEKKRRADLENVLKDFPAWKWDALADAVKKQIEEYVEGGSDKTKEPPLHELLVKVIEFCLPLRGRYWRWRFVPNGERLTWGPDNEDPHWKPNVMGMRGLSMKRLEQILNLRQRCQSFAKLENRYYQQFKAGNFNPPDSTRDELPDSCPKLLERSNRIREQRVDQTAHLILAEALGMELKNPALVQKKKERKAEMDLHGEYQRRMGKNGKPYPRCSVIVLENLERYRTSQERTKSENSRLMKWAHRAIIEKLEDMCRPFGITLMLVDPAFSSHFDSRTGLPGVRVEEVSRGFEQTYPYKLWKEQVNAKKQLTKLAADIKKLVDDFEKHPGYKGTLLLAVEGGKLFCPVQAPPCPPTAPQAEKEGVINADICAAGNIGLRGVADPQRWDIFPRLRTKQISDSEVSVTNWRGYFGQFPQDTRSEQRRMRKVVADASNGTALSSSAVTTVDESVDSQPSQSSEYPPFFVAHPNVEWEVGLRDRVFTFVQNGRKILAYPQGAYLKRVEKVCSDRVQVINKDRINKPPKS